MSSTQASFVGRVIAAYGRQTLVLDDAGRDWMAVRRGRRGDAVVGDHVRCSATGDGQAVIEALEPRGSLLFRSDAYRTKELASNVDQLLLIFASRPAFNLYFLWKALVAASAAGIEAIVVRNKLDLAEGAEQAAAALAQLDALGWRTLSLSAKTDLAGTAQSLHALADGHASLMVGQSGMGKSTLLNLLVPDANARTREFSERLNLGKQTTTATRWFQYAADSACVDTPGFQEFGLAHLSIADIAQTFPEFASALGHCRYANCRHMEEPGCAVRAEVASGTVAAERYAFYRHLAAERPL